MNKQHGFTLVELMIGLAITAIILTVGVPSFNSIIRNNRVAVISNEVVSALHLARSEAIKRSESVTVCSTTNGSTCAGSTAWATGWIVLDAGNNVLRRWDALDAGTTLTGPSATVDYLSSGFVNAAVTFQLRANDCTGNEGRDISISATGRPWVDEAGCP